MRYGKVEYKVGCLHIGIGNTTEAEGILNRLGEDGWHLAAVLKDEIFVFTRVRAIAQFPIEAEKEMVLT